MRPPAEVAPPQKSFWRWVRSLFTAARREPTREQTLGAQESRVLAEFCRQYATPFHDLTLLKLALTHRSYLSVTGQGPRESNERLEFLGDSVLGLVTSEFLYRRHPDEHEGQLTKTKSLLVSKAILSRRALRMGLGRFVLMSHSEVESGGRQRLSILADAFESVLGAVYLDQGFEAARAFIHKHLLAESDAITSDKRHTNYKSHLQEYVQNAFRTHPVYRIRSEYGPDHSKHFMVEVMVGKRTLGEGRGHNKKEAEQAAARDALEKVERVRRPGRDADEDDLDHRDEEMVEDRGRFREPPRERGSRFEPAPSGRSRAPVQEPVAEPERPVRDEDEDDDETQSGRRRRRSRRGGRSRHAGSREGDADQPARTPVKDVAPSPDDDDDDDDDDTFTQAVRAETRELTGGFEDDPGDLEPPRLDPYRQAESPAEIAPPVVDVAPSEAEADPETEVERDARIDEMERALDNFGRRRSLDYGRRGRRR